jgi:branched-chain amino acid aminotransferase
VTVWLNGALVAADAARIEPADRGLLLGDGLFETLLCRDGRPLHASRHLARLRDGASQLAIPLPWDDDTLTAAMTAVLAAHREPASLRMTLTRGPAGRGLDLPTQPRPTLLITASPPAAPPRAPLRLCIARSTRRNEHSPLSRLKTLNYLDGILARREAVLRGAHDALLLNTRGALAEATAATLFVRRDGVWCTPPLADGALPGIRRALLVAHAGAVERTLTVDDLARAQGVFLANSLGLRAVAAIDDKACSALEGGLLDRLASSTDRRG